MHFQHFILHSGTRSWQKNLKSTIFLRQIFLCAELIWIAARATLSTSLMSTAMRARLQPYSASLTWVVFSGLKCLFSRQSLRNFRISPIHGYFSLRDKSVRLFRGTLRHYLSQISARQEKGKITCIPSMDIFNLCLIRPVKASKCILHYIIVYKSLT